ncbi:hypothetical protein MMC11_003316 [Xylographa trunciseda]|nr:hypothetical protein [Xylographa trunciseda]
MAFPTPSIGDILMLSQLAWKIGCAFTAGQAGAPAQFQEVENELKSLTTAITLLAESLDEDGSLLARADERTREGLDKILGCCRQTLNDLDSFVSQYQEIRRFDEAGGLATQKSWRSVLLKNYKKIMWTTEGGSIQSLRNMLAMHTQSISLTLQALQTRSLSRLEKVIEPVADQINDMHSRFNGDLDVKIDEIHLVLLSLQAGMQQSSPMIWPSRTESIASRRSSSCSPVLRPRRAPTYSSVSEGKERGSVTSHSSYKYPQTPQKTPELSDSEFSVQSPPTSSRTSKQQGFERRESNVVPSEFQYRLRDPPPGYEKDRRVSHQSEGSTLFSARTSSRRSDSQFHKASPEPLSPTMLPPAAMTPECNPTCSRSESYDYSRHSRGSQSTVQPTHFATLEEQEKLEQNLFTEAAVLCEVRATLIDYTQPNEEIPGEWKMVEACKTCKVYLVTRKQKLASGALRFTTSIWALSNDRGVRLQQKIADGEELIPYTIHGNDKKVVLRVPAELKFHDTMLDAKPVAFASTSWINYNFENERASSIFQGALIGKTLLLSVKTKRTMRIHEGITGTFAFAEQLCGLENLRLFQDPQTGGVLAMIHYTAHFHDGYLAFYLNSSRSPLRIRDEDEKTIKVKGLNILVDDDTSMVRRDSMISRPTSASRPKGDNKIIKAVKIEFYTPEDKRLFKDKFREIQSIPEQFLS